MSESPWTELAGNASHDIAGLPWSARVPTLCEYFAKVYKQGCEDQKKLEAARSQEIVQDPFKDLARYRMSQWEPHRWSQIDGPSLDTGKTYDFIMLDEVAHQDSHGQD